MIYRHFFWDFDGTLYDSYACILTAAQAALKETGLNLDENALMPFLKRSLETAFRHFAPDCAVGELLTVYRRYAHDLGVGEIRLYPGAKEMLAAIRENGGRNYLYTHRHSASAFACMRRDGIETLFADAVTADDGFPQKPAPDALRFLMRKHGLDGRACVMVGDRDIDLDAGKNAGMATCLFDPEGFYPDYPADERFRSYAAMREALI